MSFTQLLMLFFYFSIPRLGTKYLNIPWRSYWLSNAERETEALRRIKDLMAMGLFFTALIQIFVIQIIAQENLAEAPVRIPLTVGVVCVLVGSIVGTLFSILRFRPPR